MRIALGLQLAVISLHKHEAAMRRGNAGNAGGVAVVF